MSSYTYHVVLQRQGGSKRYDVDPFDQFRTHLTEGIRTTADDVKKEQSDAVQKNVSSLRGGLAHFLSTPLKSDTDEIVRMIEESINRTLSHLDALPQFGTVRHSLWRVLEPQEVPLQRQLVGVMKRLLKNGRSSLIEAGCASGKNAGEIAMAHIAFEGFTVLPSLCAVLDRVPPETDLTMVHGDVRTMLFTSGDDANVPHRVAIDFGTLSQQAAEALMTRSVPLMEQFGVAAFTMMRSVLHSSRPVYQLQLAMDVRKVPLGSVVMSLVGDYAEAEDALTADGAVIVLERLP